jgi:carbamoyltransferase
MPTILGISAYYHDAAACLVRDGEIVAAAQEERFTRKKHDASFPRNAVAYCLREARISGAELDYVGFYDKPLLKFERLLENYCGVAPKGLRFMRTEMDHLVVGAFLLDKSRQPALTDDGNWRREFALD